MAGILPVSPSDSTFVFEPQTFRGLYSVVEAGAVVADVGASFGVMTLLMATLVGDKGVVWSFEPNPDAVALGRILVDANGLSGNVKHCCMLVGEETRAQVDFFQVPGFESVASTRNSDIVHFHPRAERTLTRMAAIDDLGLGELSALKIDVEGGEFQVLVGAAKTIKSYHPYIVMETHGLEINGIAGSVRTVVEFLADEGYKLWDLSTLMPIEPKAYATAYGEVIGWLLAAQHLMASQVARLTASV
jgi:FkbM family methyltransferase